MRYEEILEDLREIIDDSELVDIVMELIEDCEKGDRTSCFLAEFILEVEACLRSG